MKRIEIYLDSAYTIPAENSLVEGETYYLKFNINSENERKRILIENNLIGIVDINPKNQFGRIKVENKIGRLIIDNKTFDVRSRYFLQELSGDKQFETILNEIREISKGLTFNYSGITHHSSLIDREDKSPTYFERFNYYRQLVLEMPQGHNLSSLIEIILRNPKQRISEKQELIDINSIKKYNSKTIQNIVNAKQFVSIKSNSYLANTEIGIKIKETSGESIFPYKFYSNKIVFEIDNQENRFVKHFLHEINLISHYIISKKTKNQFIIDSANKMIDCTDSLLNNSFFSKIGKIQTIPSSSTVLFGRSGYREIYQHFINSRFGLRNILENYEKENIHNNLKKASELYEIWAFYKIGSILFKENINISKGDRIFKEGNIYFGYLWEDSNYKLLYNYSYAKKSGESYSLSLRPDYTIISKSVKNGALYLFDAKYKGREILSSTDESDIELLKYFKSEDIHKMHCYLDAIKNARIAIFLYPGDIFRFYEKDFDSSTTRICPQGIQSLSGVGAIPLVPLRPNQELADIIGLIP